MKHLEILKMAEIGLLTQREKEAQRGDTIAAGRIAILDKKLETLSNLIREEEKT